MKQFTVLIVTVVAIISINNIPSVNGKTKIDVNQLRCLVCRDSLKELQLSVAGIDPSKRVDVGGYRLDADGNYERKTTSQAKSEIHLSELIEAICEKMDDYVRATWKSNGTLTLLKLVGDGGQMNSAMSDVDIIQDDDLNKSLKYYCEGIMEEYEDNIIKYFQQDDSDDIPDQVCENEAKLCSARKRNNEEL